MKRRSQKILERPEWAMNRSLYKSMGYSDYDLERPMIGVANSWNRVVPGHYNLRQVSEYVQQGIRQAGGTPVEFGVIAACDGIANGNQGMHYILPSRDLIANDVEVMIQAHRLDAVVLLCSCDKIVPGMLMAAARLDLPAIMVVGGPMAGGCEFDGRPSDITSLTEGLAMLSDGKITEEDYRRLEDCAGPTCGSCSFLGTANTMCCLAEALGMSLPGTATIPAFFADRLRAAQDSGRRIVEMVEEELTARKIITPASLANAVRVNNAIGGSTNAVLHLPAVAYEAGYELSMDQIELLSKETPHVAKMNPAAPDNVPDFHQAGGVPAVMKQILPLLDGAALTVSGKSVAENVATAQVKNPAMIRTMEDPWGVGGGLAVLRGNLAPNTGITKPAAIKPEMRVFTGKAHCFDSEEAANQAILDNQVKPGEVVVIRYEGPKGGPGMREMYKAMKLLYGKGLALNTAVVTDGRFSGTNNGCFVGHVSPEAAEGGPLALVADGDEILIDIPAGKLQLQVSDEELAKRKAVWKAPAPKFTSGYLALYARLAESADKGAIIRHRSQ
ncbi:MAG: dihydroxy-acid dehydratase [Desulfarculaceae bacterium]|nr:dihydroxy-acid dehydratase [Desulfarculaceae bacterium]MCF8046067.1 dihydroxy-acid dehydratase [Desulfarculaceae bacterium]MCF8064162.1 dihydroxy-acid dehydratase [Desulfarculaceae bacterium]MCF8098516.1 dihydroxy-acid dehydratase [Desulfarculaceae bacterium]MCF8121239.1 dihydroxy-acid dehydratase [Desulfarculaceae bacterium]